MRNRFPGEAAAQRSGCPALAVIACWEKDHVKRRGVSPTELGWHRGVAGGILGASASDGVCNPASDPKGKERQAGEGAHLWCRQVVLFVRYGHY